MRVGILATVAVAALLMLRDAPAAEMSILLTLPRLDVAEYHRPYVAVWIERSDQSVAANLVVWYATADKDGMRWLSDLRQWWRRSGREQSLPLDGVTGATRPVGQHRLQFGSSKPPLASLARGEYVLVVEAVREVGGREVLRLPLSWPPKSEVHSSAQGKSELGDVSLQVTP